MTIDATKHNGHLPKDTAGRKAVPLASGVLDYFPAALVEVAKVSKAGNDKHNPGEPLHHARGKSMDHADCIARHLLERGTIDPSDGLSHTAHLAWRALALLQEECEAAGAPLARGAREPETCRCETEGGCCDVCEPKILQSLTDPRIGASSVPWIADEEEFKLGVYGPCRKHGCFNNVGSGRGPYCRAHR